MVTSKEFAPIWVTSEMDPERPPEKTGVKSVPSTPIVGSLRATRKVIVAELLVATVGF
jgi:hypothetical protein